MERGGQRCAVEIVAQPLPASPDMTLADPLAALVVKGGKPGQRCDLLATEAADLRQAHQDGGRGAQCDAVHAGDQPEPLGEIRVPADRRDQLLELLLEEPAESLDLV